MEVFGGLMTMLGMVWFFLAVIWFITPFVIFAIKGKVDRSHLLLEQLERRLDTLEQRLAVPATQTGTGPAVNQSSVSADAPSDHSATTG